MSEWWGGLSFEQQVYYSLAIVATLMVGIQTLMLLIAGTDLAEAGDFDMDGPEDHPSGIQLLSSRTVFGFLLGFGWTGVIVSATSPRPEYTAVAATLVGFLFGGAIFYLMRLLNSLKHSGTLDYENALGEVGTVYLPIPAGMGGTGRIQVVVQGRMKEVQALTRHRERLENRARVRVVELLDDNTLIVEPLSDTGASQEN